MKVNHNEIFKYYQKGVYPDYNKIIAIGDIHGDYNAFLLVLNKAKIIDKNNKWIGGNTHVVQIGDILDRKPRNFDKNDEDSEFKIISLILKLQLESYQYGGGFHPVIGNHELMNILGIFDYVSPMGMGHFKSKQDRLEYFKIGNTFAKYLACAWNPVIKIGKFLFCHGGMSLTIAKKYTINDINTIMRDTLYGNPAHLSHDYFHELFLNQNSILWNRVYSTELSIQSNLIAEKNLDKILSIYDIEHIVIGHTPQENGIKKRFNGKVLCIDTGMSEAFGNKVKKTERIHYLEINEDNFSRKIIIK
jgi:hypothetical protein